MALCSQLFGFKGAAYRLIFRPTQGHGHKEQPWWRTNSCAGETARRLREQTPTYLSVPYSSVHLTIESDPNSYPSYRKGPSLDLQHAHKARYGAMHM